MIDDRGDELVIRPLPDDPIAMARGSLRSRGITAEKAHARSRRDEAAAERRRRGPR